MLAPIGMLRSAAERDGWDLQLKFAVFSALGILSGFAAGANVNQLLVGLGGTALILIVLWDAFETIVLPRRVTRKVRLARLFYVYTCAPWLAVARLLPAGKRRETFLSFFGPLSLLVLLSLWAAALILGFGLLHFAAGSAVVVAHGSPGLATDIYLSGTTFFTLGLGDVVPNTPLTKFLAVVEAGMGFAFLAVMIGYLPVIYEGFSRREVNISMLDARAGSPPTAAELLRRHSGEHGLESLRQLLHEWERWSAELLESHLSYPVLAYFRSQHNNQSWLSALTTILDASALVMVGVEGACQRQAELTFAMARHAVVDLAQVFSTPPRKPEKDRLPTATLAQIRTRLVAAGLQLHDGGAADERLRELRRMYEPYVAALSRRLMLPLAPWITEEFRRDNWQTSSWDKILRAQEQETAEIVEEDHF